MKIIPVKGEWPIHVLSWWGAEPKAWNSGDEDAYAAVFFPGAAPAGQDAASRLRVSGDHGAWDRLLAALG